MTKEFHDHGETLATGLTEKPPCGRNFMTTTIRVRDRDFPAGPGPMDPRIAVVIRVSIRALMLVACVPQSAWDAS
jgi:hypothetical protein